MRVLLCTQITQSLFLLAASQSAIATTPVPCAPLIDYVEPMYQNNLDIFLGGGEISDDVPVFFDIPRMEIPAISPQIKLCIEDLPIPTSVGESECNDWNKCWLVIGRHTGPNAKSEDTKNCASSDDYRGTSPCYACTCSGSYFGSGSVPSDEPLISGCGLSSQQAWGVSCPDVNNGRMTSMNTYSNFSTVQINICDGSGDVCEICQGGGYQPQFRVGLQWISESEQCFDEPPFTNNGYSTKQVMLMQAVLMLATGYL
eukprot:CAMPEP_0178482032 /NCGR_PEP_ID=MMETSP0696-20121128/6519_1 /TAXON_ID=265572 /ORGANISM="Extubocellulus spinifer, Strain CCMP396" /LENGTH=256 /DNA_ID=CAMNT_0020109525 /DNA_START=169 /DNA_END=936 /DNA_ORIENTATION=-